MFHLHWAPKKSAKPPVPEILSKKFNRGFKLKKRDDSEMKRRFYLELCCMPRERMCQGKRLSGKW
jgi:hypothetical protein